MSAGRQVVEDARKFAAQFAGFIKAAEAWEGVVSVEQAVQEAQGRLAAALRDEEKLKAKFSQLEAAAIETAAAHVKEGNDYYGERVAAGNQYVADAKARAVTEAGSTTAEVMAKIDEVKARHAQISQDVIALEADHANKQKLVDDLKRTRDELEKHIRELAETHAAAVKEHDEFLRRIGAKA
jgi:chromosome segregation ATPase